MRAISCSSVELAGSAARGRPSRARGSIRCARPVEPRRATRTRQSAPAASSASRSRRVATSSLATASIAAALEAEVRGDLLDGAGERPGRRARPSTARAASAGVGQSDATVQRDRPRARGRGSADDDYKRRLDSSTARSAPAPLAGPRRGQRRRTSSASRSTSRAQPASSASAAGSAAAGRRAARAERPARRAALRRPLEPRSATRRRRVAAARVRCAGDRSRELVGEPVLRRRKPATRNGAQHAVEPRVERVDAGEVVEDPLVDTQRRGSPARPGTGSTSRQRRSGARGASASQCASGRAASASPNVGRGSAPCCSAAASAANSPSSSSAAHEQQQVALERATARTAAPARSIAGSNAARRRARGLRRRARRRGTPRAAPRTCSSSATSGACSRSAASARDRQRAVTRHRHASGGESNGGGIGGAVDEQAVDAVDRQPHPLRARRHVAELERQRRRRRRCAGRRGRRSPPSVSLASCAGRSLRLHVERDGDAVRRRVPRHRRRRELRLGREQHRARRSTRAASVSPGRMQRDADV